MLQKRVLLVPEFLDANSSAAISPKVAGPSGSHSKTPTCHLEFPAFVGSSDDARSFCSCSFFARPVAVTRGMWICFFGSKKNSAWINPAHAPETENWQRQ